MSNKFIIRITNLKINSMIYNIKPTDYPTPSGTFLAQWMLLLFLGGWRQHGPLVRGSSSAVLAASYRL